MTLSRGELIKVARGRLDLNQGELAVAAGISRNYMAMIERDEASNLTERVLLGLARALHLDVTMLLRELPEEADADGDAE